MPNHDLELLPVYCPFLGCTDLLVNDDEGKFYMLCLGCGACGPCCDSYEEAVLTWAERYDPSDTYRVYRRAARTIATDG